MRARATARPAVTSHRMALIANNHIHRGLQPQSFALSFCIQFKIYVACVLRSYNRHKAAARRHVNPSAAISFYPRFISPTVTIDAHIFNFDCIHHWSPQMIAFLISSTRIFIFQLISDRICFFRLLTNKNNANWPWRLILFGHEWTVRKLILACFIW